MLIAAPRPVESPQANRQACSNGASGLTFASAISGITVYSAKVEQPMKWRMSSPSRRDPGRAVGQVALVLLLADRQAEVGPRVDAVDALAALRREHRHDVVADGERADVRPDLLDDPRSLVAEDRRRVSGGVGAGGGVEIGVADAAGGEADQDLPRLRLGELDLLDDERLAELLEHRRAHPHFESGNFAASSWPPVASPSL